MKDARSPDYLKDYIDQYPQNSTLQSVAQYFLQFLDTGADLEAVCGNLLRLALDEVIDMPRTGRFSLNELEKTEKTYIGTKVEIVFRDTFKLKKGNKLDLLIDGKEVDVKNTIGSNWTIPGEAIDEICLLLSPDDNKSTFNFGLVICRLDVLNAGQNRDGKRTISKAGKAQILWLVKDGALPRNFFLHMDDDLRKAILTPKAGAERLAVLFTHFQGEVINRSLVECIAQQKDYMKRIRGNGGARDRVKANGLSILWGGKKEDREKLKTLGYQNITKDGFVCLKQ